MSNASEQRSNHERSHRVAPDLLDSDHFGAPWPAPLTPLIGRDLELDALLTMVRADKVRLITLTGPGGVGKSRLALRAGELVSAEFPDGVEFVSLAPIVDATLVLTAIARSFHIQESAERTLSEQLSRSLHDWFGLLILDNFEQVIDASPLIAELLRRCPRIKILVTSRAVLHLTGEYEMVVPPLSLPAGSPEIGEAVRSEAVSLFVLQAQSVRPGFALTTENVAAVVEICRRLDGLPLAIELAAARTKILSPPALLARLTHRLPLLTGGRQDQPARFQTMRATIAWSHDLLTEEDRMLFRRLVVFAGGFTMEAAEAVVASRESGVGSRELDVRLPLAPDSVMNGVTSLVDKSLLQQTAGIDGEWRFTMLETVREFGLEQLHDSDEVEAVRDAHAVWCQELVDVAWSAWMTRRDVGGVVHRLKIEHDNLRAALTYLKQRDAGERFLHLAGGLAWFWQTFGYVREGSDWLVPALEAGDLPPTVFGARALIGAGKVTHYLGDEERAGPFLRQGLAGARDSGDEWLIVEALVDLGIDEADEGHYDRANPLFDEAIARARAAGNRIGLAQALSHRGLFGWASGEGEAAEALVHEALAIQRAAGDEWGAGHSTAFLGMFACARDDARGAAGYVEESLNTWLAIGASQYLPWSLENVALYATVAGRWSDATRLFAAATRLRERIGSPGHQPERDTYLPARDRALAALGETGFAAAWTAGSALSGDECVATARAIFAPEVPPSDTPGRKAAANEFGLTERELDVMRLLVDGLTDRQIGNSLFISFRTAQKHVANIFVKLGVASRTAVVTAALRHGLVPSEQ